MADSTKSPGSPGSPPIVEDGPRKPGVTTQQAKPAPESDDSPLARAQLKAPNLTAEFVSKYELSDDELEDIASGLASPPPVDDDENSELHLTPGGWVRGPKGVALEDIGKTQITRGPQV